MFCFGKHPHSVWKNDLTCCLAWDVFDLRQKRCLCKHAFRVTRLETQNSFFPRTHKPRKENTFSRAWDCRNAFLLMLQPSQGEIWSSEFSLSACCHHSNHKPKVRHFPDDATLAEWSRRHAEDWHNPAASAASSSSEVQPVSFQTSALPLIMTYFLKLVEMRTQYSTQRKRWLAYSESRKGLNKQNMQAEASPQVGRPGLEVVVRERTASATKRRQT